MRLEEDGRRIAGSGGGLPTRRRLGLKLGRARVGKLACVQVLARLDAAATRLDDTRRVALLRCERARRPDAHELLLLEEVLLLAQRAVERLLPPAALRLDLTLEPALLGLPVGNHDAPLAL